MRPCFDFCAFGYTNWLTWLNSNRFITLTQDWEEEWNIRYMCF